MFREMHKKHLSLPQDIIEEILMRNTSGVLALHGDDGYPYALPMTYVYKNGKLHFHGLSKGHKIDAIHNNAKVSFCVVDKDEVQADEFNTHFRSVIAFGRMHEVSDPSEIMEEMKPVIGKYNPNADKDFSIAYIKEHMPAVSTFIFEIEHITGKESTFLANKRQEMNPKGV